jgi:hypothetical protein
VRLSAGDLSWEGRSGDLLVVPDARHSLEALEASAVLLTVAKLPRPRHRSSRPFRCLRSRARSALTRWPEAGWSFSLRRRLMANAKVQVRRAYEDPPRATALGCWSTGSGPAG